jgi:PDZ domain-containing secreted protein
VSSDETPVPVGPGAVGPGDGTAGDGVSPGGSAEVDARPRRRRGRIVALLVVVAVIAGVVLWSDHEASRYYIFEPGSAPQLTTSASCRLTGSGDLVLPDGRPCARLVIPGGRGHALDGSLRMVDVLVGKATAGEWALDELGLLGHFERAAQLLPNAEVLGTAPASQLACQDAQEMAGAQTLAPFVALQHLGYKVAAHDLGAQIIEVIPGLPAARAGIECNDLITSIAGQAVRTVTDVARIVGAHKPGETVTITVRRTGTDGQTRSLTLHAHLEGRPQLPGVTADPKDPFLGITSQTDTTYQVPFHVGIDVGNIGGPSAGLALTLGILDTLSSGHLTGGHDVAATGEIEPDGTVAPIGGVAQKAVAVERAGAQLFLVPTANYAAAMAQPHGHLKIEAVNNVTQALADLKAIGGQVPVPSTPT